VTANWSYSSKLTAYKKNGGWWIQWAPSLVAPNLTATEKLVSSAIPPSASAVQDASGNDLSTATDPGVHNIYLALKKSAPAGQGTPGVQIQLENAGGSPVSSSTDVLSQPVNTGVVKTTINPSAEAAAQSAVLAHPDSSMVVLQPTTGDILAVANNDGGNDFALTARVAPGSTNKIITSTALLADNLIPSTSTPVTCPPTITVNGTVFHNSNNESEPAGTPFLDDFAASCNNAFGQWYSSIGSTTLATTAQKYYGLNEQWNLGTGPAGPYYNIPTSASDGELFQELFGQGELETAPVAMASVGATVDTGTFKQPIFVPGTQQVTATPLPTNVQQDLWQMMKAVVTQSNGTGYGVFNGISSTVYGKTGTADVGTTQKSPNSWMVAFDPTLNIAIGCVVLDAGAGASFAGPEAASVLKALQ
jgi:cell division protein FtsI/penicillin-binding protein 2